MKLNTSYFEICKLLTYIGLYYSYFNYSLYWYIFNNLYSLEKVDSKAPSETYNISNQYQITKKVWYLKSDYRQNCDKPWSAWLGQAHKDLKI